MRRSLSEIENALRGAVHELATDYDPPDPPSEPPLEYRIRSVAAGGIWQHYCGRRYGLAFAAASESREYDERFQGMADLIWEAAKARGCDMDLLDND